MNFSFDKNTTVVLPGNTGTLSDELTLTDGDDGGVIIKDIQQDSPVARIGTLKKGDQLNAVTIHFDNLSSEEVSKILKYSEPYKTSLKLNAKGELRSPDFRYRSLDMGSGDQTYSKLYNSKIKPHLKLAKPSQSVDSLDVNVNRKNKMPSFDINGPRIPSPDIDMNLRTAKDVDLKLPKPKIDLAAQTIQADVKSPSLDIGFAKQNGSGYHSEGKIKSPETKKPSFSISGLKPNVPEMQVLAPEMKTDIKAPDIDIGRVNVPETKANWNMPKLQIPSFGLSGPEGSDVDFDGSVKVPGVDVSVPNVKGNYESPNVDIKLPKGDIDANIPELNKQKFTMPKFNLPSANLSTPDTNLHLKAPNVTSDLDAKLKIPKLKKPNLEISGLEGSNVSLDGKVNLPKADISAPEIKGGIGSAGIDLKKPTIGADFDMSDMNLEVPDVKLKGPGFKKPSLNMSPGKASIPDVDVNLPTPNIDLSAPKIQADVKSPKLDINAPTVDDFGGEAKLKFPKFKKPTFSITGHKPKVPELDASVPELKTDIKAPDFDIGGLKGSVDVPETKANWKMPKLELPSFGLSGPKSPDMDFDGSVKAPDVNVSVPKVKGSYEAPNVDIKLPKGDIDANIPDAELTGRKFKLPGFNWPSNKFSLSGPDKGLKVPKGQIDLSAPGLQGDIRGPGLDMKGPGIDVGAPSVDVPETKAKWKMPKLQLPSFGLSGPKSPDVDFDGSVKVPGVNASVPNVKGNYESPNVDIKLPKGDIDANIPELNKRNFTMPKFNLPSANLSTPDTNLHLKAPNVTSDLDAKLKIPKLKKPNLEISGIEGSNVSLDGKVNLPKADISAPEIKGGIGSAGIDLKKPTIGADFDMPDMNLDVPDVKLKGPGFKKPSINMSPGKASIPDVDVNLPTPNIDLSAPKIQADVKSPKLDINAPTVDDFGGEAKLKFPKFKKPTFSITGHKPKVPELDASVPELKTDIKAPDVDIGGLKGSVDVPETKANWKMPKLELPSFGLSGPKSPDMDFDGSVKAPDVNVSVPKVKGSYEAPNVDIKLPKGDIDANSPDAELTGRKFKLPGFNWPSNKFSLSGPDKGLKVPKGQIDLSAPGLQGDIRGPGLDMKGPGIDVGAPSVDVPETKAKWKMPKLELPSFGLSGPKNPDVDFDGSVKVPGVDVSVPNIKGNYESPNVDIKLPKGDIDANIPEFNKQNFTMPEFNLPSANLSTPDTNLHLKAPNMTSDLDAKLKIPKLKKPNLEISGLEGSNVSLDGKVNLPKADISAPEIKGGIGSAGIDLKKPTIGADFDMPDMNLEVPDVKLKGPGFKKPSLNMSPGKASIPDVDVNLPTPNIDLSAPKIQADVKSPKLDINAPTVDDFGGEAKLKFPKFKKPTFSITGHKPKVPELDASVPELKTDIKAPDVDIGGLKGSVDVPATKANWKMPKLELPSFGLSGPKSPDMDFDGSVKAPDVNVSVPKVKGSYEAPNVDIKLPKGDIDANIPDAELTGRKFKLPGFNWPSNKFSLSGPDKGLKVPKGQIDLSAPGLQGDIRGPGLDMKGPGIDVGAPSVDVPETKANWKMPKLELPSFGLSGPKSPDMDFDGSVKAPDVNVSVPKVKGNYEAPNVDIKLPKGDIDANIPDAELTGRKFKLPGFNWPSNKFSLSGPDKGLKVPKGQIDLSAPGLQGDIRGPGLDMKGPGIDVGAPSVDVPETKAKWKMPKLELPSFGLSGPKSPDVDFDGSVKVPSVNASVPNVKGNYEAPNVDIKLPKGDIDANIPELNKRKFTMPKFNLPSANLSTPDTNLHLKAPNVTSDLDAKLKIPKLKKPNLEISGLEGSNVSLDGKVNLPKADISAPEIKGGIGSAGIDLKKPTIGADFDMPDMNLEVPDVKLKDPGFKKPSLNMSPGKASIPDVDVNLPTPNIDLSAPKIQADVKSPKLDINAPTVDDFGGEAKLKFPKFKKPTFSITGHKPKVPELGVSVPELKTDIKAPDVDIGGLKGSVDVPETKANWKMPKLELPSFGLSGPKSPDMDFDGSVKAPDVNVSVPNVKGNYEAPNVDIKLPKGDIDANIPDAELTGRKFKLPGFNWPSNKFSLSGPDKGLKVPKDQIDLSAPGLQGDIRGPGLDMKGPGIDVGAPSVDVPETKAKWKMPKLELPSFGLSGPKSPDMDFDGSVKAPDVNVSVPNVKGNYEAPNVDIKLPKGDTGASIPDAELTGRNFKLPGFNLPSNKLSLSGPDKGLKVTKGQIDLSAPNLQGDIRGPSLDMKGPSIDVGAPSVDPSETKAKWKMPNLELPSFRMSGPKGPDMNTGGSVKAPGVDVSVPNFKGNYEAPNIDIKLPKGDIDANIPEAEFNQQKSKLLSVNLPNAKLSAPATDLNLKAPTVTSDVDAKLKIPKLSKPNLEISGIEGSNVSLGSNVKIPKADISAPEIKAGIGSAGIDLKNPMVGAEYDMPDMNLEVPDVKVKGPSLKKPSLNVSPGNVSIPDVDVSLPTNNRRGDAAINMPGAVLKGPNIGMKSTTFDANFPNHHGDFREVGVDVSTPNHYAEINAPELNVNSDDMQNKFSRETFKIRSSSLSDLDDASALPKSHSHLQTSTSSTLHITDTAMNKKSKFKFPKLFNFNHKSKGSVDFTKAKAAASSGTFTSKFPLPELELAVSKD